jgi:LysR family transcriptional regulator, benzoate and cis,cis-muconate-responsive activator of ben and cat genes
MQRAHAFVNLFASKRASMQSRNLLDLQSLIVTIAQEGSFVRASRKLRITQPSITRRVAWLESSIGAKLFQRTSRKVELTEAGRLFVMESVLSLEHADRAWNLAQHQGKLENGPIRLGYSPYIHSALLPHLFRLSTDREGATGVLLRSAPTPEEIKRVLRGNFHAALGIHPIDDQDLWVQRVGAEGFSVCIPRNHTLARKPDVTVKDLNHERIFWIPQSAHPGFHANVTKYFKSVGIDPAFDEVGGQMHAMELAAGGFGLALLPRSAARVSRTGVVFRSLADRYLVIETMIFMRRDQRYGRVKELVDHFLSSLRAAT